MAKLEDVSVKVNFDTTELKKEIAELEYLRFFFAEADFGPADDDVRDIINQTFIEETGKQLPEGY